MKNHCPPLEERELPPISGTGQPKGNRGIFQIINVLLSNKSLDEKDFVGKY